MDINLLIDTNNIANSITHSMPRYADILDKKVKFDDEVMLATEQETELFAEALNLKVNNFLKEGPPITRVFFLQDSKSWRKKVLIEGETTYKENRAKRKGKKMNWDNFEKGFELFKEMNPDFYFFRIYGLEADDLIYLTKSRLKEKFNGNLNIIYSTDSDFVQLLDDRTLIYNPLSTNPRFIMNENLTVEDFKRIDGGNSFMKKMGKKKSNPFDISDFNFKHNIGNDSDTIFSGIEENHHIDYANSKISIFEKLIGGDKKDDVPSIFYYEDKKGKQHRIEPRFCKKIIEAFEENNIDIDLKDFLKKDNVVLIKETLIDNITHVDKIDLKKLARNVKRNRLLLYLSDETIPKKLIQKFDDLFSENFTY